jgi:hypothetical protein
VARLTFTFTVKRPPDILTPNAHGRSAWQLKHRVGTAYAQEIGESIFAQIGGWPALHSAPWENGRLANIHYFRGVEADADNCVATLKPIIDVLKVATIRTGNRYRLGILRDDRKLEVLAPVRMASAGRELAGQIRLVLEVW